MPAAGRRARGGAEARRAARGQDPDSRPFITRRTPVVEVLDEEGLQIIEDNADTILEEVGIEFHGDDERLKLWKRGRRAT